MVEVGKRSKNLDLQARIALQNRVEDAARDTRRRSLLESRAYRSYGERGERVERVSSEATETMLDEIVENIDDMGMEYEEAVEDAFEQLEAQYGRST